MDTASKKGSRLFSLRRGMVLLLIFCWIVPYLLVVAVSGIISQNNNRRHVEDLVTTTVESAADVLRREFDGLVSESVNSSYIPVMRGAYLGYMAGGNPEDFYATLREFLGHYYSRNYRVRAAFLVFSDIPSTSSSDYCYAFNPLLARYDDVVGFYRNGGSDTALGLIDTLDSDIAFYQQGDHYYMARVLSLRDNRYEAYASLVLEIDIDGMLEIFGGLTWITDFSLRISDLDIVVTGQDLMGRTATAHTSGNAVIVEGVNKGQRFDIAYCVRADMQPLLREGYGSLSVVLLLALLSVPVLLLFVRFFHRRVNTPIATLSNFTHEIEDGGFGNQIDERALGSTEFVALGGNLNAMSARLEYQFERIYREELALRDARIKALQSHINPHFLGNTLEIINWEARMAGNVKVTQMLEALSTLLEAVTDRKGRPLIHLSEEMVYINSYLYILGERLGKRLAVIQDIDPGLTGRMVPRLILQPIVENAIDHGISARQKGVITIRALRVDDDWMELQVENNSPMSKEDEARVARLLADEPDPGDDALGRIGIRNVDQRLRILYGEKGGLTVKNTKNGTTLSSLCIGQADEKQIPTI